MSNNFSDGPIYESVVLKNDDSVDNSVFPGNNSFDNQQKFEKQVSRENFNHNFNQSHTNIFNQSQSTGNNSINMNNKNNVNMNPNNIQQNINNNMNLNNMNENSNMNYNVQPNMMGNFNPNMGGYPMYNQQYNPYNSVYNKNSFDLKDTRLFMNKQVDVCCEDHRNKSLPDASITEATRFCKKCESIICDSCVIDYHLDHVSEAKLKVDEYFSQQRNDLNEILSSNRTYISNEMYLEEIKRKKEEMVNKVERFFSRRGHEYENLEKKVKGLIEEEQHLKKGILLALEAFFLDDCHKKLDDSTKNLKDSKFLFI